MAQETRELICINCPMGCPLTVTLEDGVVTSVSGNTCPRGDAYGRKEVTNPRRIVTTTVPVVGSKTEHMVSVKTKGDVPKAKVREVVNALKGLTVKSVEIEGMSHNCADLSITS